MSIRMMVDKAEYDKNPGEVECIENYPGHEITRIHHTYACGKGSHEGRGESCSQCVNYSPLYMKTSYVGCVVDTGEINGYDDSDFYAVVWDDAKQEFKRVVYASTRGWSYPNGASIDATPEIAAKYAEMQEAKYRAIQERKRMDRLMRVERGKQVKIVRGRKLPKGLIGICFWVGQTRFGWSVGIESERGREFTALGNVEVILA